ncbi:MAG: hypothetical protein ABR526_13155 [Chthoniobacterales bacterium]
MAIPFLSYFKKKPKAEAAAAPAPMAPPAKAAGERMSKTVMPSATRNAPPASAPTPEPSPAFAPTPNGSGPSPVKMVSMNTPAPARPAPLPPAVVLALEPNVERTVTLDLADVVRHMPAGLVRPPENGDSERRVLLKASELERGMANGRPAVSIATLYQQVPEVFTREISPTDPEQVSLPFSVVLEQFSNLQTRTDQQRATAVPQVETPFLKVTLEDSERFGTPAELGDVEELPDVRMEPATAESLAAAEPEPAAAERAVTPSTNGASKPFAMRAAGAGQGGSNGTAEAPTPPPALTRIPFKLTPNGTGAPAPERVPASSGPSVPTSLPATPTRIPFKVSAPSEEARPVREPWMTKASMAADAARGPAPAAVRGVQLNGTPGELMITLPLRAILETLPPMQLIGDIDEVATDARVEFPFSKIEPQLVGGRVSVTPEAFAAALPTKYGSLFDAAATGAPVSLPLQDVLKNLPASSLRMRDDQEEQEKGANFDTPFSAKAAEDAKRLKVAATPVAKQTVAPEPEPPSPIAMSLPPADVTPAEISVPAPLEKPKAGERTPLQAAFKTDDELDAKTVVMHVGKLDGVEGCAIMFSDGLSLAGNLPADYDADGLCAMAPSLLQRIDNHMVETKLGALRGMTLSCAKAAITFFMHDNLCLAALHGKEQLAVEVRDQLGLTVQELSRQYSHPA